MGTGRPARELGEEMSAMQAGPTVVRMVRESRPTLPGGRT